MTVQVQIAIVGAGPGGLSAALHAAQLGLSHLLLEAAPALANTIRRYQKGKLVMDEPALLPLRSDLLFGIASREQVLANWESQLAAQSVNWRVNSEVITLSGERGAFVLQLQDGSQIQAETVVLAIGVQGHLHTLESSVVAEGLPTVQYQLDDAQAYEHETILVIGAGDAAIENALALAASNQVILVNRREEFSRAKQANHEAVLKAINSEQIECYFRTTPSKIEVNPTLNGPRLRVTLRTPEGPTQLQCDRVIARLGASPPHDFLKRCGVRFPHTDPSAVPALSPQYESNVPGLYIIGALAGYPLIKQALNQGYEVIEYIRGNPIPPADEPILSEKFRGLPAFHSVNASLDTIRYSMPLLSGLTTLQLRELMLDSVVWTPQPGEEIFHYNDYSNTFFSIIAGEVRITISRKSANQVFTLRAGQFFGEMSLISGRRRTATVNAGAGQQCVLIETPRRTMLRLINSVESVKRSIDQVFMLRAIQSQIAPEIPATDLAAVVHSARIQQFAQGETLFSEGDVGDCVYLIRSGSVMVSRNLGGNEIVLSYVAAGNYVGEVALLSDMPRSESVRAAVATEAIRLEGQVFMALLERSPTLRHRLEARFQQHLVQQAKMESQPQVGNIIAFMLAQGLGEATDVLLIDETLCIHCDNCEKACAEVHDGTSRLNREAGPTFASVHVPTSCRHCEHPHCMKDCPPDAIHRAANGEVYIADNCIGCGNCEKNCPYGVIQMAAANQPKPGLWGWLLFGLGPGPGRALPSQADGKKAVKCDMCKDLRGGPACVRACPTGAAIRVSPEKFMQVAALK